MSCGELKGTALALRGLMTSPSRSGESFRFADRRSAGIALARRLQQFANRHDVVVLALPRGGVPVAYEVARSLAAPMDVFVVRKLGLPGHPELAMGAIASGGVQVLNEDVATWYRPSTAAIEAVARAERMELERRERAYRDGRPPVPIEGRIVLLVDDGLATGSTMRAAVLAIRRLRPARRRRGSRRSSGDLRVSWGHCRRSRLCADSGAVLSGRPLVRRFLPDER